MLTPPGVYTACKKDGTQYFRVSITYRNKHISLGSYDDINVAANAYNEADYLLHTTDNSDINPIDYHTTYSNASILSFEKWVILVNFRDNGLYFKTPIYGDIRTIGKNISSLDDELYNNDFIIHDTIKNGNGAKKHRFALAKTPFE